MDKAFLVELDDHGSYSRFTLTEEDFKNEFPDTDIERVREGDTDTLKPLTHIWAAEVEVKSEEWEKFFTDMSYNLPDSDVENDNLASIDYDRCSPSLEEAVRETEFSIDFQSLKIADSSFDRDGSFDVYTAVLEYSGQGNQEETDRFQYDLLKSTGLDEKLAYDGVEVKNFDDFKELRKPEELGMKVELIYSEYGEDNEMLTAQVEYGTNKMLSNDEISLSSGERESLDRFYESDLSSDKEKVKQEYDKELE